MPPRRRAGEPRGIVRHLSRPRFPFRSGPSWGGALRRQSAPRPPNPMRQIVRLSARILQVRDVDAGQPVGYGAAHLMSRPSGSRPSRWDMPMAGSDPPVIAGQCWHRPVGGLRHRTHLHGPHDGIDVTGIELGGLARPGAARRSARRGPWRRRCGRGRGHDRLRDPDRDRPPRPQRLYREPGHDGVSGVDRPGVPGFPHRHRTVPSSPPPPSRQGDPALLSAPHPAADRRCRVLLAAGRRADRDLHRHGAGAAILYRVQPVQRRERGGDRGRRCR